MSTSIALTAANANNRTPLRYLVTVLFLSASDFLSYAVACQFTSGRKRKEAPHTTYLILDFNKNMRQAIQSSFLSFMLRDKVAATIQHCFPNTGGA